MQFICVIYKFIKPECSKTDLALHLVQDNQDLPEGLGLDLYSLVQVYLEIHNCQEVLQQRIDTRHITVENPTKILIFSD